MPPVQGNLQQVEVKFPPDKRDVVQDVAYICISGDDTKQVMIEPDDCDCIQPQPKLPRVPVEQLGTVAGFAGLMYMLLTKRLPPSPSVLRSTDGRPTCLLTRCS